MAILLQGSELDTFFEGISSAFTIGPVGIALFIGLFLLFIGVLVLGAVFQTRRVRRRLLRQSEEIIQKESKRLGLSSQEISTLTALAGFLPGGKHKKYLLVSDPIAFNTAAHRYLEENRTVETLITALRIRLGFTEYHEERTVHSSADLKKGLPVYIISDNNHTCTGRVLLQSVDGMRLELTKPDSAHLAKDELIKIYFAKKNGIHFFYTKILDKKENMIRVKHSEKIMKIQRRQFYRKKLKKKVRIAKGILPGKYRSTYLVDLGGNGATLINPANMFKKNDDLTVSINVGTSKDTLMQAKVVRVSHEGNYLHVQFLHPGEKERDSILSYLFKEEYKEKNTKNPES